MTGLVSRWATDEELVNKANDLDNHKETVTVKKGEALPSRWAVAESEPETPPTSKHSMRSPRKGSSYTPPSSSDIEVYEDKSEVTDAARDFASRLGLSIDEPKREAKRGQKREPRRDSRSHVSVTPPSSGGIYEDEDKSEVTDAARDFASRLGLTLDEPRCEPKRDFQPKDRHSKDRHSKDRHSKEHQPKKNHHSKDHQPNFSDRAEPTDGARAFAARLGISLDKPNVSPPSSPKPALSSPQRRALLEQKIAEQKILHEKRKAVQEFMNLESTDDWFS